MILKTITYHNFRNLKGTHTFKFEQINLLIGAVGSGKSTAGRIGPTFCFYGTSDVPISKLPTKGCNSEETWVEALIEDKGDTIIIKREIPTKVTIKVNGIEILEEAEGAPNNREKNDWIIKRFGDLDYFKKFRMIDITDGINVLEAGATSLRKILISFHEEKLKVIKQNLLEKKNLYEKFNKDSSVLYKHFPSIKRLNFLTKKIKDLIQQERENELDAEEFESKYYSNLSLKGELSNRISYSKNQMQKAKTQDKCPTCYQKLPEENRKKVYQDSVASIKEAEEDLKIVINNIKEEQNNISFFKKEKQSLVKKRESLTQLRMKLEGRLKQKEFKYTNKDILIVSTAIKELEKFYSYYILENVKKLEPIINSILNRMGFEVIFSLNEKGDFNLGIFKGKEEYTYKELSSGQRIMLSIAFQLALLLDKGETGLILADEGFNNLAEEDILALYEMLKELPFQIVSIVHRFSVDSRDIKLFKLNEVLNGNTRK